MIAAIVPGAVAAEVEAVEHGAALLYSAYRAQREFAEGHTPLPCWARLCAVKKDRWRAVARAARTFGKMPLDGRPDNRQ